MNDDTGGNRSWRLAWPRLAGLLAVTAGIALLVAACGGSSSDPPAGGSTTYAKALAYSQCMRAHGVPDFPDPGSNGSIVLHGSRNGNGPSLNSPQMQSADKTCRHLLPNGGQMTPAQRQQAINQLLHFSECMRSHGVLNFPDPTVTGNMIGIRIGGSGLDPNSPVFKSAQHACQSLMPGPKGIQGKGGSGSGGSGTQVAG
jgi:hypothetical protein